MITRRTFGHLAMACAAGLALPAHAADTWPAKPVSIIVAYPPGSTMDILARVLAQNLQEELKATFLVENRPGASGRIGAEYVARAPKDGYTLFISGNSTHSANPSLFKNLSYDPIKDFTPIIRVATMPYALAIRGKSNIRTLPEFVKQAQQSEGRFTYAYGSPSAQVASVAFAASERFEALGVPYKGQPPALTDLIGGQVDFIMADLPVLVPYVHAGTVRVLTVFSDKRSALLPEVPTMLEGGVQGYNLAAWIGVSGPAGLPPEITSKLSGALRRILVKPDVTSRLQTLGMQYSPNTPAEFATYLDEQLANWGQRVRDAGIQPE
ncbi:tripartite tricarboxylate transporter substrate binding protein [Pigmentiphaga sp. D-2]|uniref:Bug family tripartite tricarboxylate transporter substrate binding protein n=1 Tax=Pigmentiphaga sp. D-2 TaxID=1002116 RepID=UPI001048EA11|nr:tripartite tricarboxylate transporter substrate binding protein [Pigmentiphaga sp. D-2]